MYLQVFIISFFLFFSSASLSADRAYYAQEGDVGPAVDVEKLFFGHLMTERLKEYKSGWFHTMSDDVLAKHSIVITKKGGKVYTSTIISFHEFQGGSGVVTFKEVLIGGDYDFKKVALIFTNYKDMYRSNNLATNAYMMKAAVDILKSSVGTESYFIRGAE